MIENIAAALLALAVSFMDRALDAQIDRLKDGDVKETARRVEDYVVGMLRGAAGIVIAQAVARAITVNALERWFKNDETTGTWG